MTRIDRYIGWKFVGYFVASLLVFVTFFTMVDLMSNFTRYEVPTSTLLRYYGFYFPEIIYQMVPIATLIATVFTLSNLNKSQELIALFSLGYSLARISAPILVLVSLISVGTFWLGDRILPQASQQRNYIFYVEIRKKPFLYSTVKLNKIWYRSNNILFNIKALIPEKAMAQGITLYYFDEVWNLIQVVQAETVRFADNIWSLEKGMMTIFSKASSFPVTQNFDEKKIVMAEEIGDLQTTPTAAKNLKVKELKRFIAKNREAGLITTHFEVEYFSKFGFAFAGFVMSLLGIPFSVTRARSGGAVKNLGVCLGLTFLYWLCYSSSLTLGKYGLLPPMIAAWGPNLIALAISILLLSRLGR